MTGYDLSDPLVEEGATGYDLNDPLVRGEGRIAERDGEPEGRWGDGERGTRFFPAMLAPSRLGHLFMSVVCWQKNGELTASPAMLRIRPIRRK